MPNPKDRRSRLRKWIDRASLTMDSGVVVLCILAIATASMLVIRHFRNSPISAQYAAAVVPKRDDISGVPRVIDGDTLDIGGIRVRLFGIDAPEHGQICRDESNNGYDCGARASEQINDLISGQAVSCLPRTTDRYGRTVAVCSVAGNDLGRELVSSGWAVACERYSRDYISDENLAHNQRLGLWRGSFERPSEYRADKRTPR